MAKYDPIERFLGDRTGEAVTVTFAELDQIVGGLPPSARKHRPWWGNEVSPARSQARAWMAAGFLVEHVDLEREVATFRRAGS